MRMRCSLDFRQRVVNFVRSGGSKAEAARRFKIGEASVYRWLKPNGVARPDREGLSMIMSLAIAYRRDAMESLDK